MGDVFYAIETAWNKAKFGSLFNTIKAFTREGILTYKMKLTGTPLSSSKTKRTGAVYTLVR
ncbi:unnamed protein product [marine sediment metagenome]|uniref:Uncharacterized protein n=1 Tax=marine sediment metagenome TaxID=412755 RepID=X0Z572_9ZZZZ